jgi:uncharacterized iron-regulated protein
MINDLADDVVVDTYRGMANATSDLLAAVTVLTGGNLNSDNLLSAQAAWIAARQYWESSEGFLWGPIDTDGFDPKLDDWPVNKVDLDNILASNLNLLDQNVIEGLETTVKGFHTIEYLLFNDGSGNEDSAGCGAAPRGSTACQNNILAALSEARRSQYLEGITVNVNGVANDTLNAWTVGDSNGPFVDVVLGAGKGSSAYPSQKSLLQEFINGIIGIADEVSTGKLADPYAAGNPLTVESKFSGNSLTDFQYNIRSIRNVMCGRLSVGTESAVNACNLSGNSGLAELVHTADPALHDKLLAQIDDAIGKIASIPGPYYEAVRQSSAAPAIEDAIEAVATLAETMQSELLPLLDSIEFRY